MLVLLANYMMVRCSNLYMLNLELAQNMMVQYNLQAHQCMLLDQYSTQYTQLDHL